MDSPYNIEPTYINGGKVNGGKVSLFALHYVPKQPASDAQCIIMVPSFAEEMNRCRYMQTMLAHALTAKGYGLLAVDPFGTGDSQGEFEEADWEQWIQDTLTAADYAGQLGYQKLTLLGIRLGALLAAAAAPQINNVHQLVFWQPVTSGKSALNQFLRIKIAASIGRDEEAGTTAQFEELLSKGNNLEVAGYDVSPALYYGIQAAHLDNYLSFTSAPISWYTVLASEERKTPRGDVQTMDKWRDSGARLEHHTVVGPAFWQAHERTLAPALVTATAAHLTGKASHE